MQRIKHIIGISTLLGSLAFSQFISQIPSQTLPTNLNGEMDQSSIGFLNSNRFDMNHGFSVSMLNVGGQNMSMAAYTNQISYWAKDNLKLTANISLMQSTLPQLNQMNSSLDNTQIGFGASLDYKLSDHSHFSINFQNYPTYQRPMNQSIFTPRLR
ncbi:MAG: hypothetical protein ISR83_01420 [Candidatus Marinimicrobia bacterium]|nr:hypothetical protein [Candidatus Neomarinimicrobiota bacterium]